MADYRYLLDTNIVSELIRNPRGLLAETMFTSGRDQYCCTSIIVACELRYGAAKKQSAKLSFNVDQVLNALPILSLENNVDEVYAQIRTDLERRGLPIGHNDLLIAAHALSLGLTVVTDNEREFLRIEQLNVENWLSSGNP
jgi:tRNA(fMet)-specific endonuclease VapC